MALSEAAAKKIDVLLELSMHKLKSYELIEFLNSFEEKEDIKKTQEKNCQKNTV